MKGATKVIKPLEVTKHGNTLPTKKTSKVRTISMIASFVAIVFLVVFYMTGFFSDSSKIDPADIYTVTSGNIENVIRILGKVQIVDKQTLGFGQAGKVKNIYVKKGDIISSGQLLAEIDKKDIVDDIASQKLMVQNAKVSYNKLFSQVKPADKIQAKNSVENTANQIEILQRELETLGIEKENKLLEQKSLLEETQKSINILKGNYGENISTKLSTQKQTNIITAENSIKDANDILNYIDGIFGITQLNKSKNDSFEIYLSAKNPSLKNQVENSLFELRNSISQFQSITNNLNVSSTVTLEQIQLLQEKNKTLFNKLSTLIDESIQASNNSITSSSLSQATVDGWVATLNTYNTKVVNYLSTINLNIKQLSTEEQDLLKSSNQIATIKRNVQDITNNYTIKVKAKQEEIASYERMLELNKATYKDMTNGPDSEDKALQSNTIQQYEVSLNKLEKRTSDYEIRSLFDGVVSEIDFKVGDFVSSVDGITIENPGLYEVEILVDQVDIVKISRGQTVRIVFDAYPGQEFSGQISEIQTAPIEEAGVISYKAKITINGFNKILYDGMTANVDIILESKDNVVLIPNLAIFSSGMTSYAQTLAGIEKIIQKEIVLGTTDGVSTEIVKGLTPGEKILLQKYELASGDQSEMYKEHAAEDKKMMQQIKQLGGGAQQ